MAVEFTDIVHASAGRVVGELLGADEIAAAQFSDRDVDLAGCRIDQALDQKGCFRATCAAIGIHRRGVSVDAAQLEIEIADVIDAGGHRSAKNRDERPELTQISPHIGHHIDFQAKNSALVIQGQ